MSANSGTGPRKDEAAPARRTDASSDAERKERQSDLLDEGLQETFPASDPVSVARVE